MKLQKRTTHGIVICTTAFFALLLNPLFDVDDLFNPQNVIGKTWMECGLVYLVAYAAFSGSGVGLVIRYIIGTFFEQDKRFHKK